MTGESTPIRVPVRIALALVVVATAIGGIRSTVFSRPSPIVTQYELLLLHLGMNYGDACRVIGSPGEVVLQKAPRGLSSQHPDGRRLNKTLCRWTNADGSWLTMTFEENKAVALQARNIGQPDQLPAGAAGMILLAIAGGVILCATVGKATAAAASKVR